MWLGIGMPDVQRRRRGRACDRLRWPVVIGFLQLPVLIRKPPLYGGRSGYDRYPWTAVVRMRSEHLGWSAAKFRTISAGLAVSITTDASTVALTLKR